MSVYKGEVHKAVEIVVRLWIDEDADVLEVVREMDYNFTHQAVFDTEIVDIITEI